jgi:hypothetical protein
MIEIGSFKIEWLDDDHILVTRKYGEETIHQAKICGGDMETFLDGIFLSAEMTYISGKRVVKTVKETVDDGLRDDAF